MTAFLLFVALVAGSAAYVAWAWHCIAHGAAAWWFVVGAPIAYFAPAFVLVTLWFALSWIWRTPRPPEARLGFASTLRLYLTEIWTVAASWLLMVVHQLLIRDPVPAPAQRPVVLVHGVLVNDGVWLSLRRFLATNGVAPIYTINYGPRSGPRPVPSASCSSRTAWAVWSRVHIYATSAPRASPSSSPSGRRITAACWRGASRARALRRCVPAIRG